VNNSIQELLAGVDVSGTTLTTTTTGTQRPTWAQAEGSPLPLGVTWIEEEQAFNFAVHSEHGESVTLLLSRAILRLAAAVSGGRMSPGMEPARGPTCRMTRAVWRSACTELRKVMMTSTS